jgi:hypothetical protein
LSLTPDGFTVRGADVSARGIAEFEAALRAFAKKRRANT